MKIWELETKNGRVIRVAVENKNQEKRLRKKIFENKSKEYEVFTRVEVIQNGISSISNFEKFCDSLY